MTPRNWLAAAWLATSCAAWAQTAYPAKPIKLVVPYAPGGSADIAARLVSDAWGKALGGTVYIENKAGAGGNLGVDAVAKAEADGHTLGLQTVSLAINPGLVAKMPYDTLKDLAPIGMVASSQHVLVTGANFPAQTVAELVSVVKTKPGKFSYGSAGSGSTFHMSAELFKAVAGVSILHIPYRGGGPALIDTISGQVDMSFPVLAAAVPHVQAGKLKALGVTGTKRSPLLPQVPTIAESGVPNYAFETWFMVFAPAKTPQPVIDKLNAVWGMLQFGIKAIIAPSFGEIYYSNAMGNQLLLVTLPPAQVEALMQAAEQPSAPVITIDIAAQQVRCPGLPPMPFDISQRHKEMFLKGVDVVGLSLTQLDDIQAFARQHWAQQPWLKDVAARMKARL